MGLADSGNLGQTSYGKNHKLVLNKGEERYFMEKGRKLGGVVLKESPVGDKQELRALTVFHWLSCWGSQSLVGDAACIVSYWEL